ncbi:MAG: hypothetical protein IKV92_00195 [Akkermansia sp.]|nr:hypothetical protein [Akkermansia sp.]
MRAVALIIPLLLCNMPLMAWDGARAVESEPNEAEVLCKKLIDNAKTIDSLLHSVKDTASAEAAAPKLEQQLREMRTLLAGLETLPFDAETTNIITRQMSALTHIYQSYMPLIQELLEKNAYGSSALMEHLHKHNSDNDYYEEEPAPDTAPYAQIYQSMETALSSAVYSLRKAADIATAKDAALIVSESLAEHRRLMDELVTLSSLEEQSENDRRLQDSLINLRTELEREYERLKELQFFGEPDLPLLMPEYLNLIK